jgi:putative PIN family toxin of toxin-antitoxin system
MRRIVLDTNCLLQSLPSKSPYHKIWSDVLCGKISLCVNTEILDEYEEILSQKINSEVATNVVEAIARLHTTVYQEIYVHFNLIRDDADDNKFADCAVASGAEFIVTNDKHYNVLKRTPWPDVNVLNIKEFIKVLL